MFVIYHAIVLIEVIFYLRFFVIISYFFQKVFTYLHLNCLNGCLFEDCHLLLKILKCTELFLVDVYVLIPHLNCPA